MAERAPSHVAYSYAPRRVFADVYRDAGGQLWLACRPGADAIDMADCAWVGSAVLDAATWSRRLAHPLDGGIVRVAQQHAADLAAALRRIG